ncbi:taurine catabolism dioxygenase TauD [Pseudomonas oryzihabitans]|nr:taurine catabolism dioxygenase TauD [Pseudomonas psychrotolerans]
MGVTVFQPLRLDLSEVLGQSVGELKQAIARAKVLVINNQDISVAPYVHLMRRLGLPVHHVLAKYCLKEYREVLTVTNLYRDGQALGVHEGGGYWHTDMSYKSANTVFTSLLSVRVPEQHGETEFIDCVTGLNQIRQWLNSSDSPSYLNGLDLENLRIHHRFGNRDALRNADAMVQKLNSQEAEALEDTVVHPLVFRHPLVSTMSLYAPAATAIQIEGVTPSLSHRILDALVDFLIQHAPRYRHAYHPGDIVIWDNLSTLHRGPSISKSEGGADARLLYRMNVDFQ